MTAAPAITSAGARKAAILLIQLGKERASSVMGHFNESEVELVSAEIARLEAISASESETVMSEFRELLTARAHIAQGGLSFAQQLLEQSLGSDRASEIIERLDGEALRAVSSLACAIAEDALATPVQRAASRAVDAWVEKYEAVSLR